MVKRVRHSTQLAEIVVSWNEILESIPAPKLVNVLGNSTRKTGMPNSQQHSLTFWKTGYFLQVHQEDSQLKTKKETIILFHFVKVQLQQTHYQLLGIKLI